MIEVLEIAGDYVRYRVVGRPGIVVANRQQFLTNLGAVVNNGRN